jgi:hypothetical protein
VAQYHPAHYLRLRKIGNEHAGRLFFPLSSRVNVFTFGSASHSSHISENPQADKPHSQISPTAIMGYEDSVYLAKLAEQAERYEG